MKTVATTVEQNLCCSCGVCKGICPKNCITYHREHGMFLPEIDTEKCVSCGLCADVCPGLGHTYTAKSTAADTVTGEVLACFNAWSRESDLRHVSASGGVVSTIVKVLLEAGVYDAVFTLDTYDYHEQLKTRRYTVEDFCVDWKKSSTPKSRYLPVSHEDTVSYIRAHRSEKLIIIGTSCAMRGMLSAIDKLGISRNQYLFIGLFCDKVFNYNVLQYWNDTYSPDSIIEKLHFKNKESGGWPGDMKFYPEEKEPFYVPLSDRAKAKAYFMPERCLYCVDKLNVCADISVGDNYTGKDESEFGSNSVIVRTSIGLDAWEMAREKLEIRDITITDVEKAQAIDLRLNNLYYGDLRHPKLNLNQGVQREKEGSGYNKQWETELQKLSAGAVYDTEPDQLTKQIKIDNKKPNPVARFIRRAFGYIRRKLKHDDCTAK